MAKVFINPGHCPGIDPGAINKQTGISEAEIVLEIGCMVEAYLKAAGCEVKLLQSDNLAGEGCGKMYAQQLMHGAQMYSYRCIVMPLTDRHAVRKSLPAVAKRKPINLQPVLCSRLSILLAMHLQ